MNRLKYIFEQTLMVSFGITLAISIEGLVEYLAGGKMHFEWYVPGSAILGGLICAIPSTFLLSDIFEKGKKEIGIRIIVHCVLLYILNSFLGWVFKWFTTWNGFIFVSISYLAVYIFAWAGSFLLNRQEDKQINDALEDIRDAE